MWSFETPSEAWHRKTLHDQTRCLAKHLKEFAALHFANPAGSLKAFRALTFRVGSGATLLCCCSRRTEVYSSETVAEHNSCSVAEHMPNTEDVAEVHWLSHNMAKILRKARSTAKRFIMFFLFVYMTILLSTTLKVSPTAISSNTSNLTWATQPRPTRQLLTIDPGFMDPTTGTPTEITVLRTTTHGTDS